MAARSSGPQSASAKLAGWSLGPRDERPGCAVGAQRQSLRNAVTLGQLRDLPFPLRRADDDAWFGIANEIIQLRQRIGGVQRHIDGAKPQAGEIEDDRLRAFLDLHRHPVAEPRPGRAQHVGIAGRDRVQIAIGDDTAIGCLDEGLVSRRRGGQQSPI